MRRFAILALALAAAGVSAGCSGGSQGKTGTPGAGAAESAVYVITSAEATPLSPLALRPIDPATGADLPGPEPFELGHHGSFAISPDGRTLAMATADDDFHSERLSLFDLAAWRPLRDLELSRPFGRIAWSPDGERIYALVDTRLLAIDPLGDIIYEAPLPIAASLLHVAPDGDALYVSGPRSYEPADSSWPVLVAIDAADGGVRAEVEVPSVKLGNLWLNPDHESGVGQFFPGEAMSPDGRFYYYVHSDEDRVTVVDLAEMRVRGEEDLRRPGSLLEQLRGLFAGTAEAKPVAQYSKGAAISPDGRRLYVVGWAEEDELTYLDLQVIDTETLRLVATLKGQQGYWGITADRSGQHLYVVDTYYNDGAPQADLVVLDSVRLKEVGRRPLNFWGDVLVGRAP